jgi:hypothetical protein
VSDTIQVATLKYAINDSENGITVTPPLVGIVVEPATNATSLMFGDGTLEFASVLEITDAETGLLLVTRGANGTTGMDHAAGCPILAGAPPNFVEYDPSGECATTTEPVTQLVNQLNGNLWACEDGVWTQQNY